MTNNSKDEFPLDTNLPYNEFVQNLIIKCISFNGALMSDDQNHYKVKTHKDEIRWRDRKPQIDNHDWLVKTVTSQPVTKFANAYGKMWEKINKILEHF